MSKATEFTRSLPQRALWRTACAFAMLGALTLVASLLAQAQTYSVIHNFTGGGDGGNPYVGLTMDAAGNLYGTTYNGGNASCDGGCGTVFKLKHSGSGWVLSPIYTFSGGSDGAHPYSRVSIARDGTLYGATYSGGTGCGGVGCGTLFHLRPSPSAPRSALSPWNEEVIYTFTGESDGANPQGDLTLDQAGNVYGTTLFGGSTGSGCPGGGCGVVYELARSGSGWTEKVLYSPQGDGPFTPYAGVIFDASGNLYGVFNTGHYPSYYSGAVYQMSPSGSGWTEQIIYTFSGGTDGGNPVGGLIIDARGNLFGTTVNGGDPVNADGTAYELSPANGGWNFTLIYTFGPFTIVDAADKLLMDSAGNLYGTTIYNGSRNLGTIYKIASTGIEHDLHDFLGSDGAAPMSIIVSDANGDMFGTASLGGMSETGCHGGYGCGVVWEITP